MSQPMSQSSPSCDFGVGVLQAGAAVAQTFDFRALQNQAALERVEDVVVMQCALVTANDLDAVLRALLLFFLGHCSLLLQAC